MKVYRTTLIAAALFLLALPCAAQYTLPLYSLEIDQAYLDFLYQNPFTEQEFPAVFSYLGDEYPCEVRFRGATGRDLPKKSWKIRFDDEGPFGQREMNLNAEYRDRSLMRNALCLRMCALVGLPAADAHFVSLEINGDYYGVYCDVESVDRTFFDRRGLVCTALFKSLNHGCRFAPANPWYRLPEYYELETGTQDDFDSLAALCVFVSEADSDEVLQDFPERFQLSNVLLYFATQIAFQNYDGFTKNYYLSRRGDYSFRLVPWDCDATLGNDWQGEFNVNPASSSCGALEYQALFQQLLFSADYRQQLSGLLETISGAAFDSVAAWSQEYWSLIRHDVYLDSLKRGTNDEFDLEPLMIADYLTQRREKLEQFPPFTRVGVTNISGSTSHVLASDNSFVVQAKFSAEVDYAYVSVVDDDGLRQTELLYDDGTHGDTRSHDGVYSRTFSDAGFQYPLHYELIPTREGNPVRCIWPPAGTLSYSLLPLQCPTIIKTEYVLQDGDLAIENVVITPDGAGIGVVIRNDSEHALNLSACRVRIGETFRSGRISPVQDLAPGGRLLFTNKTQVMSNRLPGAIVTGGYHFLPEIGDSLSLTTSTGKFLASLLVDSISVLNNPVGVAVINEINYNSPENFDSEDWIELEAPYGNVNLTGWTLTDGSDVFSFPQGFVLMGGQLLVVTEDLEDFREVFPTVDNVIGDLGFGLSASGETITLRDQNGVYVDQVSYLDRAPWPTGPDGHGYTLELISPFADNLDYVNWRQSAVLHGTPGEANSVYVDTRDRPELPKSLKISRLYPNPFNASISIEYELPSPQAATISIYDVLGRMVSSVMQAQAPAGSYRTVWNATTPTGVPVSSGVYFVRIETPTHAQTRKIILQR
jgi:spore coat protein H